MASLATAPATSFRPTTGAGIGVPGSFTEVTNPFGRPSFGTEGTGGTLPAGSTRPSGETTTSNPKGSGDDKPPELAILDGSPDPSQKKRVWSQLLSLFSRRSSHGERSIDKSVCNVLRKGGGMRSGIRRHQRRRGQKSANKYRRKALRACIAVAQGEIARIHSEERLFLRALEKSIGRKHNELGKE